MLPTYYDQRRIDCEPARRLISSEDINNVRRGDPGPWPVKPRPRILSVLFLLSPTFGVQKCLLGSNRVTKSYKIR